MEAIVESISETSSTGVTSVPILGTRLKKDFPCGELNISSDKS